MTTRKRFAGLAIAALLVVYSSTGATQAIISTDVASAQPLVFRDGAMINGCGLRVLAVSGYRDPNAVVADFSVSVSIDTNTSNINGFMKAGLYQGSIKADPKKMKNLPVTSFYLSNEDGSLSAAPAKFVAAENSGFVLGAIDANIASELLSAIEDGTRLQIGLKVEGEGLTRIYRFTSKISEEDMRTQMGCMGGFLRALEAASDQLSATP